MKKSKFSILALISAWLLAFAIFTNILSFPPMEHIIREELNLNAGQTGLVFSIPVFMVAVTAIPSGLLSDKIGIQKSAGIGAIILTIGGVLRGVSTDFVTLILSTIVLGLGIGIVYPNLPKLVSGSFPKEDVGMATGIYSTGVAVGASVAMAATLPVIYPITGTFQGTFLIWTIPAIIATILWWILTEESSPEDIKRKDTQKTKVFSSSAWKNKGVWMVGISFFLLTIHFYTWAGWTPALMVSKGATPDLAATITSVLTWVQIPGLFLLTWISDRIGLRCPILVISGIMLAIASVFAIYVPLSLSWILAIFVGIVLSSFSVVLILSVEVVPKHLVGTSSGIILSIGYAGGLIGPWFAGIIIDKTSGLYWVLIFLLFVGIAQAIASYFIPETGPKGQEIEKLNYS